MSKDPNENIAITLTEAEMADFRKMMYEAKDAGEAFVRQFENSTRGSLVKLMAIVLLKEHSETAKEYDIEEMSQRLKEWVVTGKLWR